MATILLVDDSIPTLNRLASCIRRWGHQVNTEAVGSNVVNALTREPVELVLLDVLMAGSDGIDVLRAIRKNRDPALAATPVVMYSMARDPRIIAQALKAGAQDYIIKATATEELRQRLSKYLVR